MTWLLGVKVVLNLAKLLRKKVLNRLLSLVLPYLLLGQPAFLLSLLVALLLLELIFLKLSNSLSHYRKLHSQITLSYLL